jgi:hypothetical protein
LPWEAQAGFAWQLGSRPLNARWVNPRDDKARWRAQLRKARERRARQQFERELLDERLSLAQQRTPPQWASGKLRAPAQPRDPQWQQDELVRRRQEDRELEQRLLHAQRARERAVRELSRRFLLLSADAIVVGPTENGVGLESFLAQERQTSGADATLGLRAGAEGEPVADWVKMRAGTYLEPSRFAGVSYRVHATTGFDVRLFTWDLFGLLEDFTVLFGASADVAERYLNVGVGLGLWH